jgi:hypothetical protein
MLISEKINIKINTRNKKKYPKSNIGDIIEINIKDLPKFSRIKIKVKCDICNKEVEIENYKYIKNIKNHNIFACSKKCANKKRELTNLKKYGYKNTFQNEKVKNKCKKTKLKKYGDEYYVNTDKAKKTKLEKYNNENYINLEKMKKTKNEKYGDENYSSVIIKIKKTKLEKYGDENYVNIDKAKKTNLNKYGSENYMLSEKHNLKREKNFLKKYSLNLLKVNYPDYIFSCKKCNKNFTININTLLKRKEYNTIICTNCNPINSYINSGYEIQLQEFIKENYNGKIILNSRNIISKELDIYLPELKLAFEFNGLYWHSELYKEKNYHLNKTEECKKNGIQLIHIYEDDWNYKQDIIKSMILNKLNKNTNKIFARKTEIKEIDDNKLVREFLNENHIQGFVGSSVKLGLFYENELVSLMTFGKRRVAMGKKITNNDEYELLRFCNKLNTNVIGGASKLFKYFINNYKPKEITTYADRSYSNGNLYNQLGFEYIGKTEPNYYYIIDGIKHHRFNFRKDKLIKEGYDKNKTEYQIMSDRGYYKIYNSGNLKFIFTT